MTQRALFSHAHLDEIQSTAVDAKLGRPKLREHLLLRLPERVRLALAEHSLPLDQLRSDLQTLNARGDADVEPPLALWLEAAARRLGDDHRSELFFGWAKQARARVRGVAPPSPIAAWRAYQRQAHAALQPFFSDSKVSPLSVDAVVRLNVRSRSTGALEEAPSLRGLLNARGAKPSRWVIFGEPGAGKSTMARSLTWQLAAPDPSAPVPILLSLTRALRMAEHPFEVAESSVRRAVGPAAVGLSSALFESAKDPNKAPVWLLLDGFDEVPEEQVAQAVELLLAWHRSMPWVSIAVLSRPIGWPRGELDAVFRAADVQPLQSAQQHRLLSAWLGENDGSGLWRVLADNAVLLRFARNPLMLTLLAMLSKSGAPMPSSRMTLYDHAIGLLVKRGHDLNAPKGVRMPTLVRAVLRRLSFALTVEGGETWDRADLERILIKMIGGDDELLRQCRLNWRDLPADLLDEIAGRTGIIGQHDGPQERWRFLHRSLRERLAAEFLVNAPLRDLAQEVRTDQGMLDRQGASAALRSFGQPKSRRALIVDWMRALASEGSRPGQWGETLGMTCALLDEPVGALEDIRAFSRPLALKLLADADTLPGETTLALIESTVNDSSDWKGDPLWDGHTLARLLRGRDGAAAALWQRVTPHIDFDVLAWLHYALTEVQGVVDRRRFFMACGLWPIDGPPEPALARVEPGTFEIGAPPREAERRGNEGPQRTVKFEEAFELGVTQVTVEQYGCFDPNHRSPGTRAMPVTHISWWRARLYASWVDCALAPEEAWEFACRAGTSSAFWSGNDRTDLERVGWFSGNAFGLNAVALKPANCHGLFDMHGNVWEWCSTPYSEQPLGLIARVAASPSRLPGGPQYVLRGGAYPSSASDCRSARRMGSGPGRRTNQVGFRLYRST